MSYAYPPPSSSSTSPTSVQKPNSSSYPPQTGTSSASGLAENSSLAAKSVSKPSPAPLHSLDQIPDLSSSTVPPPTEPPPSPLTEPGAWFSYPLSYAANSIYRRVSAPPDPRLTGLLQTPGASRPRLPSPGPGSMLFSRSRSRQRQQQQQRSQQGSVPPLPGEGSAMLVQPPSRKASPFQPPPLTALSLAGFRASTPEKDRILSKALAEEIRLLVPPRLQLVAEWDLIYSVEQDGASLATLYSKCQGISEGRSRAGYVIVVRDAVGGVFGSFLTDAPKPSSSYYGTGECFLWSASIQTVEKMLAHLPPPPSGDTTHMESRNTTLMSPTKTGFEADLLGPETNGNGTGGESHLKPAMTDTAGSAIRATAEEEERIRFRAFPYSGVNDYMIYCEHEYMSVGGGDGKYGLWLDDRLEQGVSSPSLTFGNEALSEEGEKFEALGVEVWFVGG